MAGVMSGVLYAPLTAIFLTAESSTGYDLLLPLMIVSVISFLVAKRFSSISPDLEQLAKEGKIFTREHDQNLLSVLQIRGLIDKDVQEISIHASFYDLVELIHTGKRNFIAVINDKHTLEGIIMLDDIRPVMLNKELYDKLCIQEIMIPPPTLIGIDDDVRQIIKSLMKPIPGIWR